MIDPRYRNEFGNGARTRTITKGGAHAGDDRQRHRCGHHDDHGREQCHATDVTGART